MRYAIWLYCVWCIQFQCVLQECNNGRFTLFSQMESQYNRLGGWNAWKREQLLEPQEIGPSADFLICPCLARACKDQGIKIAAFRVQDAGGILLAITNVPELCSWVETTNCVYGRSNNPYDLRRIVGGSSGGEGALLSAAGTPVRLFLL